MTENLEKKVERESSITRKDIITYMVAGAGASFLPSFLYTAELFKQYSNTNALVNVGCGLEMGLIGAIFGALAGVLAKIFYGGKYDRAK